MARFAEPRQRGYDARGTKLKTDFYTQVVNLSVPLMSGQVGKYTFQAGVVNLTGFAYNENAEYQRRNDGWSYANGGKVYNSEGYSLGDGGTAYYYYRKDHLGNVREVTNSTGSVVQRTQYYSSGLPWAEGLSPSTQSHKYNGKEFIEMNGYDTYDYGARLYYPAVPHLTSIDPLCEKYYSISPYVYCANNPVNLIDPDGRDWYQFENKNGTKSTIWQEGNNKTVTINDQVYNNIGTTYLAKYDWGAISYNQNSITDVYPYMPASDLSVSDKGLGFLIDREGLKLKPYNDSKGFSTVGVGHLIEKRAVTEQDKKDWAWFDTKQEAMDLLQTDLSGTYEKAVKSLVDVPLMQFQYDAIVSFTFNVGVGGLKKSNFLKELNGGNYNGQLMLNYRRPSDIIPRRKKEVNLFNNATY